MAAPGEASAPGGAPEAKPRPYSAGHHRALAERRAAVETTSWLEYLLTHYRGIFCLVFLLPLSALFGE